jgi:hypothetical protein
MVKRENGQRGGGGDRGPIRAGAGPRAGYRAGMKRARSALLGLAGLILPGTVVLWVGTRGTGYQWGTKSLPGEHAFQGEIGGGEMYFWFADRKRYPYADNWPEGFESFPVSKADREVMAE